MTVEALKVLKLSIQAFRGFRDAAEFDFSRPVTVVYAANGTGKTSLCQAIEWIVTGTVVGVYEDDLRCKQATKPTEVRGTVAVGMQPLPDLHHTLSQWSLGAETRQNKILEALAPQVLEDRSLHHNLMIARRREWIRGTHFLFTDSLAVLVDANDDTRAARRRIFADILGVRHLEEAVEDIDRYSNRIRTAYNEALRGQKSLTDEASSLEQQIAARRKEDNDENAGSVTNLLAAIYSVLGEKDSKPRADEIERVQAAEARIAAHESLIKSKIERCSNIAVHLPQIAQLRSQIQTDQKRLSDLISANASIEARVLEVQQALTGTTASRDQMLKDRSDTSQQLAQLREHYQSMAAAIRPDATLQSLQAEFRGELALPARSRNQKRQQLASLRTQLTELNPICENIRLLRGERAQTVPPDPEKLRIDRAELRRLQAERRNLQRQYDALAEPLRQLQEAAAQFAEHLAEGHTCPVCAHDWKTPAALRAALAAAAKGAPVAITAIERSLKANADASRTLQDTIRAATTIQTNLNRIQEQLDPLEARVQSFEAALEEAAGPGGPIAATRIDAALSRLICAAWIATFQQIIEEIAKRHSTQLNPKVSISKVFSLLETTLTKYIDDCAKREAELGGKIDAGSLAANQQRQVRDTNLLEKQAIEIRLQGNVDLTNRFNENWKQLAGSDVPFSNECSRDCGKRLSKESNNWRILERNAPPFAHWQKRMLLGGGARSYRPQSMQRHDVAVKSPIS